MVEHREPPSDSPIEGSSIDLGKQRRVTAKKREADALEESEERYRLIAENITDVIWVLDLDLNYVYVSPSIEQQRGYKPEDLLGKSLLDTLPSVTQEDRELGLKAFLNDILKGKGEGSPTETAELEIPRKDGSTFFAELSISGLYDEHGQPTGIVGVTRDITERKRTAMALKESEERFRLIAENVSDIIFTMDSDLNYTYISPTSIKHRGYTPEEAMKMSYSDLVAPGSFETVKRLVEEFVIPGREGLLDPDTTTTAEVEVFRKDGSTTWVEMYLSWILDDEGKLKTIFAVDRDISERKRAAQELEESEQRYRSIVEATFDGILIHWDGKILDVNQRFSAITGYEREELIGTNPFDLIAPEFHEQVMENMERKKEEPTEVVGIMKDGRHTYYEYVARDTVFEGSKARVISIRDLTDRRRAEEAIKESGIRYRALAEATFEGVLISKDCVILDANPSATEITGYSLEELKGMSVVDLIVPSDGVTAMMRCEEGAMDSFEATGVRKDGSHIELEAIGRPSVYKGEEVRISAFRDISDRKKSEEALRDSEERYRLVAENVADIIFVLGEDLVFQYVSPSFENLTGFTVDELIKMGWRDMLTPDSMEKAMTFLSEKLIEALEAGSIDKGSFMMEMEILTKPGPAIWTEVNIALLHDQDGDVSGILGVARDISARRDAERAIRESESRYVALTDATFDAIFIHDGKKILEANKSAAQSLGYTINEIIGMDIIDLMAPEFRELAIENIRKEAKEPYSLVGIKKDGTPMNVEAIGTSIPYKGGKARIVALRDITEQTKATDALEESEEKFRTLVTNMPDIIWRISATGEILFVSPHVQEVMGYTDEEFYEAGNALWESGLHPDEREQVGSGFRALFEEDMKYDMEYRFKRKDGQWIWVHDRAIEYHEIDGKIVCDGILTDITNRKEAEDALRYRSEFEHLISELSSKFISLKPSEVDTYIILAIEEASSFVKADAGLVFRLSEDDERFSMTHLWHSDQILTNIGDMADMKKMEWPWSFEELRKGETIRLHATSDIPDTAASEMKQLDNIGIRSSVSVTMSLEGSIIGFLTFCSADLEKEWSDDDVEMIRQVGQIFTNALQRKIADKEISNIFELSSDLIGVINLETNHLEKTNPAFEKVLGYRSDDLKDMRFTDILHTSERGRTMSFLENDMESEGAHLKTRVVAKDGKVLWFDWMMNTSTDDNQIYLVGSDVTEREMARETLMKRFMRFKLDDGNVYLVKESSTERSFNAFTDLLNVGYDGKVFSREINKVYSKVDKEKVDFHWLTERDVKSAVRPDTDLLDKVISEMPPRGAILIDRLDFLISKNGFEKTLSFIHNLREEAYLNNHIVILSIDPTTLTGTMLPLIQKECLEIEPIHRTTLSEELMSILRIVFTRNKSSTSTSYNDILQALSISKPTARRRIGDLIYYGYLIEKLVGKKKTFVMTEKGRTVFIE